MPYCKHILLQLYKPEDLIQNWQKKWLLFSRLTDLNEKNFSTATENHHDKEIDGFTWVPSKSGNIYRWILLSLLTFHSLNHFNLKAEYDYKINHKEELLGQKWRRLPLYWFTSINGHFCFQQAHKTRDMIVMNHIKCLCLFLTGTWWQK